MGAVENRWPRGLAALPWPFSVAVSFLGGRADRWLVTDSQRTADRFQRRQRAELADLDSIETGQREAVYATRRRALSGEDLSHTINAAFGRAVTTVIERNRGPQSLCEALAILYPTRLTPEALTKIGDFPQPESSLAERVRADLQVAYVQRETEIGTDKVDLRLTPGSAPGAPVVVTSSRMAHLWDALAYVHALLGFDTVTGADEVFRDLVLARIIEPTSKLDTARVLEEVGIDAGPQAGAIASYRTLKRRLPRYAHAGRRARQAAVRQPGQRSVFIARAPW